MPFRRLQLASVCALVAAISCDRPATAPDVGGAAPPSPSDTTRRPPASFAYAGLTSALLISPVGLDFGNVQVGSTAPAQKVTITNITTVPVIMSGAGGAPPSGRFGGGQSCQGITLAPDASCEMSFAFSPSATGTLTDASIGSWNGQAFHVDLRGNGVAPKFRINPVGLDFSEVPVGTTAPTQTVTVTNIGVAPVTMSGAGGAPPTGRFGGGQSCQGLTLAVGASCQLSFAFSPNAPGELTDASIGSWNGQNFHIALRGVGVNPKFRISPSSLEFGEVTVGTTAPAQSVTITNINQIPVTMSGAGGAPPTGRFGGGQVCQGLTLAPGASCTMAFAFSPNATGPLSDASVGSWNGQSFHIALHGVGLASGAPRNDNLLITPSGLDFGDVTVGSTAPTQTVKITNVSAAPILMSGGGGAPPSGRFGGSQSCQGLTLAVGASCEMSFAFTPNAPGDLTDASIGSWNGQNFHIALHGAGKRPVFRITPSAIDFSDVQTGTTAATEHVSITNLSPVPVVMSGAGGAPPTGRFGGGQSCQGLTLAPNDSCDMSFAFSPATVGALSDASVGSWNGQPFNIALQGNGVAPHFLITPFALDFGLVPVGVTGPAQTVTITNDGVAAVTMSGAGGAPPTGRFGGGQSCQGLTLARGASCTMSFAFSPLTTGLLTDASIGSWNAQSFDVALRGTGFAAVSAEAMDLSPGTISVSHTVTTSAILLSSATFDATAVTLANVRMQVNGTTDVAPVSRGGVVVSSVRDWNGDGRLDRMFSFQTSALAAAGLVAGSGADALVLHDEMSAAKWRASDAAPPAFVP
jgi:hypothetical protein